MYFRFPIRLELLTSSHCTLDDTGTEPGEPAKDDGEEPPTGVGRAVDTNETVAGDVITDAFIELRTALGAEPGALVGDRAGEVMRDVSGGTPSSGWRSITLGGSVLVTRQTGLIDFPTAIRTTGAAYSCESGSANKMSAVKTIGVSISRYSFIVANGGFPIDYYYSFDRGICLLGV